MNVRLSPPRAAIVLTGSELLDGRVRDRNGAWLSASLIAAGFAVDALLVLPDDLEVIVAGLGHILRSAPAVLVVSGGLGTTHDDVTMEAVASAVGLPLEEDETARRLVEERLRGVAERRRLEVGPLMAQGRKQALLPRGARVLPPAGVAPGAWVQTGDTAVVVLPGVPAELEAMWPPALAELVARRQPAEPRVTTLRLFGVGEMQVVPVLEPFVDLEDLTVGVTAAYGEITVRATARGEGGWRASARLVDAAAAAGLPVYSADGRTLDELLATRLREAGATVAVAESCTGGLLGARLTDLAGSSDYFLGGVIGYANEVKARTLKVPQATLAAHGAVSAPVAEAMARGVRRLTGATFGVSTTGVAGPGGGTPAKPVGLVYLGLAGPDGVHVSEQHYAGDRDSVRRWAVNGALHLLRRALEGGA